MTKNSSSKELTLSSNERLNQKNISLFKFSEAKKITSNFVKFYTFHVGFKKKREDLLIAVFNVPTIFSAVYSKTSTPSAPIIWDKNYTKDLCKILIVNAGNANAHTGDEGINNINQYVNEAAIFFNCPVSQIFVSSTGVIGEQLDPSRIINAYSLINASKQKDLLSAARAIMTTDTFSKTIIRKIKIDSKEIRIFGFAKGSGMICPNMGTMLAYIFIEESIPKKILKKLLLSYLDESFNSISVDGDTSTSDTVALFSLSDSYDNKTLKLKDQIKIASTLKDVMFNLSLQVVSDGEGISKLMSINVSGGKNYKQVSAVAFSIANSPLVKTAIAGEDANWGRVIMAIGKADTKIDQNKINLKFGNFLIASNGKMNHKINITRLDEYMKKKIIEINVDLGIGKNKRTVYSSDLTHEYIRINGDYRS
jgi:glutamate N-acetyltransferase/amino-acid N-acetyltransferase